MQKTSGLEINSRLLAKNTLINFLGQALPLIIGIVTVPFIVRGLGIEQYGIFSIAWVVLGYFTIFDLGLGRATTKYVAEDLGKSEENKIANILWTSVTFQAALGFIGALILFVTTDLLIGVLNIPLQLIAETRITFYLIALSIPVVLISSSFSGMMEAVQRFDIENLIKIPSSILTFILPLAGLYLGFGLSGIVALVLLARFGALVAFIAVDLYIVPALRDYSVSFTLFIRLVAYGGWVTVSNIIGTILTYLDRFLIPLILTIAALGYYTVPYNAITCLLIISVSLALTLFPAFSALGGVNERQRLGILLARSTKYVLLASGPIVIFVGLFANDILNIWLGADFAMESTVVLQLLALGVLINSLAYTPYAFLQGIGRPDIPAKFHIIELPICLVMVWILINKFGINGAAGAWALRVTLDAVLLFVATFKIYGFSAHLLTKNGTLLAGFSLVILTGIGYVLKVVMGSLPLPIQCIFVIGVLILFTLISWRYVLDGSDREAVIAIINMTKKPGI